MFCGFKLNAQTTLGFGLFLVIQRCELLVLSSSIEFSSLLKRGTKCSAKPVIFSDARLSQS